MLTLIRDKCKIKDKIKDKITEKIKDKIRGDIKQYTRKEIFEMKSIEGINIAGKTSKLDNIYITLLCFSQEVIIWRNYKYLYLYQTIKAMAILKLKFINANNKKPSK